MTILDRIRLFLHARTAPAPTWRCFDCRRPVGHPACEHRRGLIEQVDHRGQVLIFRRAAGGILLVTPYHDQVVEVAPCTE